MFLATSLQIIAFLQGRSLSILASRIIQESMSLMSWMVTKHRPVACSHQSAPHCYLPLNKFFSNVPWFNFKTFPQRISPSVYSPKMLIQGQHPLQHLRMLCSMFGRPLFWFLGAFLQSNAASWDRWETLERIIERESTAPCTV